MATQIQVELPPEEIALLREVAAARGISVNAVIRESIHRFLDESVVARVALEDDPILQIIGLVEEGPGDTALRHDDYLTADARRDDSN
jgi:hypothetical protein